MKHDSGCVLTELNPKEGIWCEFCTKDTQRDKVHLISAYSNKDSGYNTKQLMCTACAKDLIICLQRSLTDALLTDKL